MILDMLKQLCLGWKGCITSRTPLGIGRFLCDRRSRSRTRTRAQGSSASLQDRDAAAERLVADALALQEAGAVAVVLEMVPAAVAKRVTAELTIPTVGIGAGPDTDAQVLVWSDMAGMDVSGRRAPRFVKRYAEIGTALQDAAASFVAEVRDGEFPAPEHGFE